MTCVVGVRLLEVGEEGLGQLLVALGGEVDGFGAERVGLERRDAIGHDGVRAEVLPADQWEFGGGGAHAR